MSKLDQVSVATKANVFFDGKCISHTVHTADGARKSVGVILPSKLVFDTAAPEVMEVVDGTCRVKLAGESEAREYKAGQSWKVAANSSFEIETSAPLHYVCHFG